VDLDRPPSPRLPVPRLPLPAAEIGTSGRPSSWVNLNIRLLSGPAPPPDERLTELLNAVASMRTTINELHAARPSPALLTPPAPSAGFASPAPSTPSEPLPSASAMLRIAVDTHFHMAPSTQGNHSLGWPTSGGASAPPRLSPFPNLIRSFVDRPGAAARPHAPPLCETLST
jgi:hypothetical protein